ncbi:MAG: asparagine synthase (glutamine-hydrolyzing) [Gemmatimonadetes bacterium]|nr:asparagine synthase (glutamine-hydrolyzing) [Gemmatimonadota bacterium]
MCGIAGIAGHVPGDAPGAAVDRVHVMVRALAHRGPDDEGILGDADVPYVFGHRRLAVIAPSAAGHQPMRHLDSGCVVTFNGEIVNYRELRDELGALGRRCETDTDTEVLLAAWAEWGAACVTRLRGMFAFAIWDPGRGELSLVRDHLGVKPLYYWWGGRALAFASEVRALLAAGVPGRSLSPRALHSLLAFGSVQDPWTLVDGVRSLPPAHIATWGAGTLRLHRYWTLPRPPARSSGPLEPVTRVAQQLAASVRSQLVSDVPLGAFLSGGIDSSAIAALMAHGGESPHTLSVVFDEPTHDESRWSRAVAATLGTAHTELRLTGDDVRRDLAAALAAYDQPSLDGLNTWFVARLAREAGLTVALSGAGGDELFAGYDGFRRALRAEHFAAGVSGLPRGLRRAAARLAGLLPGEGARKAAQLLEGSEAPALVARRLFSPAQVGALLAPDLLARSRDWQPDALAELATFTAGLDPVNRASAYELSTYLVSTILRDTDQMSMAHALEVRVPLLDPDLVSLVFSIPGSMKVSERTSKPLLVHAMADRLPPQSVNRPKRGFELPFEHWLRGPLHHEMARSFAAVSEAEAWPFRAAALRDCWRQHEAGRLGWGRVWTLYVVRDWLARHRLAA